MNFFKGKIHFFQKFSNIGLVAEKLMIIFRGGVQTLRTTLIMTQMTQCIISLHYFRPHLIFLNGFRLDNENTRWMPTNIRHISEVTEDQVNRVRKYKYFDLEEKHSCDGVPWRCVGALTFCACWRNNHIFRAPICDI